MLTNNEIKALLEEPKTWPGRQKVNLKQELSHYRFDKKLESESEKYFLVFIRQLVKEPLDFSVGLLYRDDITGEKIRLLRCNGPLHPHKNKIENEILDLVFHIHEATERYIVNGFKSDSWAYETNDYFDIDSALNHFSKLANINPVPYIRRPPSAIPLFEV